MLAKRPAWNSLQRRAPPPAAVLRRGAAPATLRLFLCAADASGVKYDQILIKNIVFILQYFSITSLIAAVLTSFGNNNVLSHEASTAVVASL